MYEICKYCKKEVSMMDGRAFIPNFYYRSKHLRMEHNIDTTKENVADYFEFVEGEPEEYPRGGRE